MKRKVGLGALFALIVLIAIIAVRTMTFQPAGIAAASGIQLAAAPSVNVARAAEHLGAAIRFQTVSHQDAAENQQGEWDKLLAWLQVTYPNAHRVMKREVVGTHGLLYTWSGSDPALQPIVLMAHQDVVPVTAGTEKDWKYPAFSGQIAEDAVWGRGSVDDKGSLITLFEAFDGLAKQGYQPKRTVLLVSGSNEEVGGGDARAIAALLAARGIKALFTLDEGSVVIRDAPITNGPAILIGVAEKGYATLKITAQGQGGHSSMPGKELATIALAKAVVAINDKQFPMELRGPTADLLGVMATKVGGVTKIAAANSWLFGGIIRKKFSESPAGAAALHTTIAPTMLSGSPKENVLPQMATALINYRIAPWDTSASVMARAKAAVASLPVTLEWDAPPREPSPVSSANSGGWKLIRAAAEARDQNVPVSPYLVVAGTDSRSLSQVSTDVYRFAPVKISAGEAKMIHGTNEHMTLDNLVRMIIFYSQLIETVSR